MCRHRAMTSSEHSEQNTDKSMSEMYWSAVETGREVARTSRYEGVNNPKLSELLPELSDDEIRVLGENIEQAIQDEVKRTLLKREREVPE